MARGAQGPELSEGCVGDGGVERGGWTEVHVGMGRKGGGDTGIWGDKGVPDPPNCRQNDYMSPRYAFGPIVARSRGVVVIARVKVLCQTCQHMFR